MKTLIAFAFALIAITASSQTTTQFVVAVKEVPNLKLSDGSDWTLEIGEVFPLLRFVSDSERRGGIKDANDKSNVLVQIDNLTMIAPTSAFKRMEESQSVAAAITYHNIVMEHRRAEAEALELLKKLQALTSESRLSVTDRSRMVKALRNARLIKTLREGDSIPDDKLVEMYQKVMLQLSIDQLNMPK